MVVNGKSVSRLRDHVCYGSEEVRMLYIPPPEGFSKGPKSGSAVIEVVYMGFPENARIAFDYATGIWASLLRSDVKIRITAEWTSMTEQSVLGSSSPTSYYRGDFIGALRPDAYYSVSLAEKIAGTELNETADFEISLKFNSAASWYFGLDGQATSTTYDLVTVVLHELCHGFGFSDSFNTNETLGTYGINGAPVIYDTFVEDSYGRKLTDDGFYTNPSASLLTALTSGNLYFSGPLTRRYAGSRQALYAPGVWDPGSSISHLSETATQQYNALMTPFIAKGEAIHDPGMLTMSLLGDLGWIHTWVTHSGVPDTEEDLNTVDISFEVASDTLIRKRGAKIFYKFNDATSYDTVSFSIPGNTGSVSHTLTIPAYNTLTSYFIAVSDTFGRIYNVPAGGGSKPNTFFIGVDTVRPVIDHTPYKFILSVLDTLELKAVITDNLYPVTARVEYRLNGGTVLEAPMVSEDQRTYFGDLLLKDFVYTVLDTIYYRIVASDGANTPNLTYLPASGYYKLPVYPLFETVEYYFTSFNEGEGDFLLDNFNVRTTPVFKSPALHTRHPYESPEVPEGSIEYQAMLRYPVALDQSGLFISYKEVVLVEPGEDGAQFGSEDFYDYVVIEGSTDGGRTWVPLTPGYDSRANSIWETAYNSALVENNSTYNATPDMYVKRTIELKDSPLLSGADEIVIRFRLYSDPYAHGWGWVIDDFFIKAIASSVEKVSSGIAALYPNPGPGRFTLQFNEPPSGGGNSISIISYSGKTVRVEQGIKEMVRNVDISDLPDGLYTVVVERSGVRSSTRYLLIR